MYKLQHVKITYQFKDRVSSELIETARKCGACNKLQVRNPMNSGTWLDVKEFKHLYKAIIEEDLI